MELYYYSGSKCHDKINILKSEVTWVGKESVYALTEPIQGAFTILVFWCSYKRNVCFDKTKLLRSTLTYNGSKIIPKKTFISPKRNFFFGLLNCEQSST